MYYRQSSLRAFFIVPTLLALLLMVGCGTSATPTPLVQPTNTTAPPTSAPTATTASASTTETSPTPAQQTEYTPTPTSVSVSDLEWKQAGLAGTAIMDLALFASGSNIVLAAGPTGTWRTSYDYTKWEPLDVKIVGNATSAAIGSADVLYATSHNGCASGGPAVLNRSTDGGKTWQQISQGTVPHSVVALNANSAYGTTCAGIANSTDSGATWNELPAAHLTNYDSASIAVGADGPQIYAAYYSEGGSARIQRSTDGGSTWSEVTPPNSELQASILLFWVTGTEGNPEQGGLYMASPPANLWLLPEGSNDWKQLSQATDYRITALYVDTSYSEEYAKPGPIIYTARASVDASKPEGVGVFRSVDGGATWEQVGKGLGQQVVSSLALAPHDPSTNPNMVETLLAGTNDGVWALPMPKQW